MGNNWSIDHESGNDWKSEKLQKYLSHVRGNLAHLAGHRPEQLFDLSPGAQVEQSQTEEVERFLANLQGIVPRLEQTRLVHVVPYLIELVDQFVRVLAQLFLLVPDGERGRLEHLEYQHRVVGGKRAPRLGDDVGLGQVVLHAGIDQRRNRVVYILLYRVVHAALARRGARAVVVDAQAAAYVDKLDVEAHVLELYVELRSLFQGVLDAAYFGYLAADVEVNELEAVGHFGSFEKIECVEQFAGVEAELAAVAAALFPLAAARAGQLDADADVGANLQPFRNVGDEFQFVHLLDHEEDAASHLLGQQRQFDVVFVLVAVADDERVLVGIDSQYSVEFGFRAGLQTDVEFLAVAHNLLDHRSHLVHLDGIDDKVLGRVAILVGRLFEAFRDFLDTVVENIGETQQNGCRYVAHLQLVHQLLQVDRSVTLAGRYGHVTLFVD